MRETARPSGAVAELFAAEFEAKELGVAGEMVVPAADPTPPPPPQPLRPPPPDWEAEEAELARVERERYDREVAAARAVSDVQRLQAEIAAADQPEPLPRRRGWMRKATP